MTGLFAFTSRGFFCRTGGFHVDPSGGVERAVVTHAHGDHSRRGSREYWCAESGAGLVRGRVGRNARVHAVRYGERFRLGEAAVSLHPAGHMLGSAQVRVESSGEVWVISGDYKRQADPSCEPFEVVPCDVFVTEATFARPDRRWESGASVAREILGWWDANRRAGLASVLYCYAVGKSQRVLAELAALTDRGVYVHSDLEHPVRCYREAGVRMLSTTVLPRKVGARSFAGELVLAPPRFHENTWLARFGSVRTAFASGWMQGPGSARARGHDAGFALSDHADWPDLVRTISETGARRVFITHGAPEHLLRHLRARGVEARELGARQRGTKGRSGGMAAS